MLAAVLTLASGGDARPGVILTWVAAVSALSAGFALLAYAKTDGQWRWRWGK
jgi:hypothetical protein